jgi:hypothetical protein
MQRIKFDISEQLSDDNKGKVVANPKILGTVTPNTGKFKGQHIKVTRKGSSGVIGILKDGTEVYVFYSEIKKIERIKA